MYMSLYMCVFRWVCGDGCMCEREKERFSLALVRRLGLRWGKKRQKIWCSGKTRGNGMGRLRAFQCEWNSGPQGLAGDECSVRDALQAACTSQGPGHQPVALGCN